MRQIIEGCKEMVKLNIVHRDLKPANILFNNGIFKLADFGMAKYV
jgi:serine/threonine-protein kinase ULK/ATG1